MACSARSSPTSWSRDPMLATSPLIQVTPGLMIWTIICFGITFFVLRKYAFGPIQQMIDARREKTRRQIEQATYQALGQIREEVGKLSLLAAEKITRKSLTGSDQQRLIDEALAEIDFSELEGSRS